MDTNIEFHVVKKKELSYSIVDLYIYIYIIIYTPQN